MSSPDQSVLLGCLAAQRGALAEAEGWFRQALELEPDSAEALSNLGNALREQGRGGEALMGVKIRNYSRVDRSTVFGVFAGAGNFAGAAGSFHY
jgi:tetratricopeptide (TPR) repeat protein